MQNRDKKELRAYLQRQGWSDELAPTNPLPKATNKYEVNFQFHNQHKWFTYMSCQILFAIALPLKQQFNIITLLDEII